MQRALTLAARGVGRTAPNPPVGAVVVANGRVVGEGWHHGAGLPHAEALALAAAGARARGGTLYVTLEPCDHVGRTPPCTRAILAAGVRRCVVATRDPHPIVDGRGLRRLRAGGVRVEVGLLAPQARELVGGYWLAHTASRPRVTWKVAASLDGRIADARGRSRWITGAAARRHVHAMRAHSDAVVIGSGTARADDPRLTVRGMADARQPLRVVCDTRLALPARLRLFAPSLARGTVVACGRRAPERRARALLARGVRVWRLPETHGSGGVSARALARRLAREGCHEVMLESGPTLGTAWLRAGLVDRIALFSAPLLIGAGGLAWCGALPRAPHALGLSIRTLARRALGHDTLTLLALTVPEAR